MYLDFTPPKMPSNLCFPGVISEESPLKLLYCILYLLATVLITGLGFYLYFKRIIKALQKRLLESREIELTPAGGNGHAANRSDTTISAGDKERL
jgi:hypothetical protein